MGRSTIIVYTQALLKVLEVGAGKKDLGIGCYLGPDTAVTDGTGI